MIPKVPAFVRDKYNSDDYDPLVVSIGPYHHGHPRLQVAEELKPQIFNSFVNRARLDEQLPLNEVLKVIHDLRSSYAKGSTEMYGDRVFARMMLQDAAFVVEYIIEHMVDQLDPDGLREDVIIFEKHLGRGVVEHVTRDFLLKNFLNWSSFRSMEVVNNWPEPGNLVKAVRTVVIAGWSPPPVKKGEEHKAKMQAQIRTHAAVMRAAYLFRAGSAGSRNVVPRVPQVEGSSLISKLIHSFHSVTELKAKGIRIRLSETNSLLDVSFRSGLFFSTLQLPAALATVRTKSVYSNIIAYEMGPASIREDYIVTAYVIFMKSLIESPKDVKELQDKGVIKNMLGSDEEVVKLYRDIYTYGIDCSTIYSSVIQEIQQHYNSKAKTWLADLLYTYFHSPWTVIALLGSILVILLAITQTYYAVHPKGNN